MFKTSIGALLEKWLSLRYVSFAKPVIYGYRTESSSHLLLLWYKFR